MYQYSCDNDLDIKLDPECKKYISKMINHHSTQVDFWIEKLPVDARPATTVRPGSLSTTVKPSFDTSKMNSLLQQYLTSPKPELLSTLKTLEKFEDKTESNKSPDCNTTCPRGYKPICAENDQNQLRTFITEECMDADACETGRLISTRK